MKGAAHCGTLNNIMKGLFLILFSTFLVGMATGVFVYFMSGLSEPIVDFPADDLTTGFEITADAYGGCQMQGVCPSYRINNEGEYVYVVIKRQGESERREDSLSSSQLRALKKQLAETDLDQISTSHFTGTCPVAFDGLAYVYALRIKGEEYRIDTCEHNTEGEPLFHTLEDYFEQFAD
jgi:hypothetical protein